MFRILFILILTSLASCNLSEGQKRSSTDGTQYPSSNQGYQNNSNPNYPNQNYQNTNPIYNNQNRNNGSNY